VLTFDDSTKSQAAMLPGGRIDPDSAVGIMLEFARDHPDFRPAATFYVNERPFGADPRAGELSQRLLALGFELGNHTLGHVRLDELGDDGVQRQIVLGNRLIRELAPDAEVATIALPFGLLPSRRELALRGSWDGEEYEFAGAFLAGAEPSPSPISQSFDPAEIPRIRTDPGDLLNGSSDWLARLDASPELRYVSDGRP
jgi:peptidoglycan/xylan/chitin deacetylase (PgdA/CDA1 family)